MAFVVDLGSFETRCGFSDEFAPCYVHRSVSGWSFDSSSSSHSSASTSSPSLSRASTASVGAMHSFGTFPVRRHSRTASNFASLCSPWWASAYDTESSSVTGMLQKGSSTRKELLKGHLSHIYGELTNATSSIAFRKTSLHQGEEGFGCLDVVPIPFHFVVPEECFNSSFSGGAGTNVARRNLEDFASTVLESSVCPAFYASRPSVMSTLGSGRVSAFVLDVGHGYTSATAVVDGVALQGCQHKSMIGGQCVNERLLQLIGRGSATAPPLSRSTLLRDCFGVGPADPLSHHFLTELCHDMKMRGGAFVECPSLAADNSNNNSMTGTSGVSGAEEKILPMYIAPDGQVVVVPEKARSECFEVLFGGGVVANNGELSSPSHGYAGSGLGAFNVGQLVTEVKKGVSAELRPHMPLLVCGATSGVGGFHERLLFEMKRYDMTVTDLPQLKSSNPIIAPLHSLSHLQWSGAALASSSTAFTSLWVSREEYAEEGASVLNRKIFQ